MSWVPEVESVRRDKAARVIQNAWKSFLNVTVFQHFKSLINIRRQGEPRQIVRYFNPKEAELLDAAAGIHVRFRLGGVKFPPDIYYKIFTERHVEDLCANSPRDYTKLSAKYASPVKSDNLQEEDRRGWYLRTENNGWRLVSDRMSVYITSSIFIKSSVSDTQIYRMWDAEYTKYEKWKWSKFWVPSEDIIVEDKKKSKFHFSKLKRRQDIAKKRKIRKIEWMRQMYYAGHLESKSTNQKTLRLIHTATKGLIRCIEDGGIDSVMEWEVDEVLNWTNTLNFDEYVANWKEIATSNSSANFRSFRFEQEQKKLYGCAAISEEDMGITENASSENIYEEPHVTRLTPDSPYGI